MCTERLSLYCIFCGNLFFFFPAVGKTVKCPFCRKTIHLLPEEIAPVDTTPVDTAEKMDTFKKV
jgi:hypothetical protein